MLVIGLCHRDVSGSRLVVSRDLPDVAFKRAKNCGALEVSK